MNALIDTVAATHANVAVLDWDGIVAANPKILYSDHLHMRPAGAALYAEALVDLIDKRCIPDASTSTPSTSTSTSLVPGVVAVPAVPALRPGIIDRCGAWLPPIPIPTTTVVATTTAASIPTTTLVPVPTAIAVPSTTVPSTTTTIPAIAATTTTITTLVALPTPA